MKKQLVLVLGLAILATPAFATKARLLGLGEDISGSQYIDDNRNIFLNAAYVNNHKNSVILEWGANGKTTPAVKEDVDAQPQAEGGFLYGHGNMVYGLYLGAETFQTHEARKFLSVSNTQKIHQDNQIDAFVGSQTGDLKWGANLTYSANEDDATNMENKSLSVRLGVIAKKIEGFVNVGLINEAESDAVTASAGKDEFDGQIGIEAGATYDLGAAKVFAYTRHVNWDQETNSTVAQGAMYVGEAEVKTQRYILGLARELKMSDRTRMFFKLAYVMNMRELSTDDDGDADLDDWAAPATIALEFDATSWLTLRGSLAQNIMSKQDYDFDDDLLAASPARLSTAALALFPAGERTIANSTNVNAGATLKFGELSVDGLVGTTSGATGNVVDSKSETGVLSLKNLMTRVAMTYRF